jgi:hypothetical protein
MIKMTDLEMLIMALLAVAGAIFAAVLGWGESGDPFDARKFLSSIGRAIVAGLLVATGLIAVPTEVNMLIYIGSFVAGMGIDAAGNRIAGIVLPTKPKG